MELLDLQRWISVIFIHAPKCLSMIQVLLPPRRAVLKLPLSMAIMGVLLHRGYSIEDLAMHGDYIDTCYLLLYGDLPSERAKEQFAYEIGHHTMLHDQLMTFFQGFLRGAHPMAIMVGVVGALSAFYHDTTDINDPQQWHGSCASIDCKNANHRRVCL